MNMNTGKFCPRLGELFGIPEMTDKFGPLKWDHELCGTLTDDAAKSCSLKAGIPVSAGSHDVTAAFHFLIDSVINLWRIPGIPPE